MRISKQLVLMVCMFAVAMTAYALRPTHRVADEGEKVNLETMIPASFGDWQEDKDRAANIVNPEVKQRLADLYSQTLSRVYLNKNGESIMLTIAYGADQSDAKSLHYPEVCYPSQGFQIESSSLGVVATSYGAIRIKRLFAVMGQRNEPITYWTTVANKVVVGSKETKIEQLKYGFKGKIPDGLLFRVSSIGSDLDESYRLQDSFIKSLVEHLPDNSRQRLAGLGSAI